MNNKLISFLGIFLILLTGLVVAELIPGEESFSGDPGDQINGQFTFNNTYGDLTNISFELTFNPTLNAENIGFDPSLIPELNDTESEDITFTFTIPTGQAAGNYTGTISAKENDNPIPGASYDFELDVNEMPSIEFPEGNKELDIQPEDSKNITFIIKNNGNKDLEDLAISYNAEDFEDQGNNQMTLTFDEATFDLPVGEEKPITMTIETEESQYLGEYSGQITVSNADVSNSFTLKVTVESHLISIDLDISSDDSELLPGEKFEFDITVENIADYDMEDVKIKVWIEDIDDNSDLTEETKKFDLDEGDDKRKNFGFTTPLNVDEGDFTIKVRVDGEEKNNPTNDFRIFRLYVNKLEVIKDEDDEVTFDYIDIAPTDPQCGSILTVSTKVVNTGKDDQDDMYLKLEIEDLSITQTSEIFNLDSDSYDDRSKKEDFIVELPKEMESKEYTLRITAYDDNDDILSASTERFTPAGSSCTGLVEEEVTEEEIGEESTVRTDTDDSRIVYLPTSGAVFDFLESDTAKTIFWIIADIALVIIAIYFVVTLARRKK